MGAYEGWKKKREVIDWDDIDASGREPVEPGLYKAQCISAKRKAVAQGKPGFELQWQLLANEDGEEIEGTRVIYDTLALTTGAKGGAWKVKQVALAADVDPPEGDSEDDVQAFCDALLEQEVWIKIIVKPYQGRDYNRVGTYMSDEDVEGADEPQGDRPKGKKKAKKKATKKKAKARREEEEEEGDEEEEEEEGGDEDEDEEEEEDKPRRRRTRSRR
jgi:hypothetical protein